MSLEKREQIAPVTEPEAANGNESLEYANDNSPEAAGMEDPFKSGRERIGQIGKFFSEKGEQAKALVGKAGGSLSRFWERTKSFAGEAAAAVFSAPELARQGAEALGDKVAEKGEQFSGFVTDNYERAKDFGKTKVEQVQNFANQKIELAKDVAAYGATKTVEGLHKVKSGVTERYNGLKQFGENALAYGKMEAGRAKDRYNLKVNKVLLWALEQQRKPALEREATAGVLLEQAQARFDAAKGEREGIDGQMARVSRKIELLQGLQVAAA